MRRIRRKNDPAFQGLRPKNMLANYGLHTVYLMRKENLVHVLWDISDIAKAEVMFGSVIAHFSPAHQAGPRWFIETQMYRRASLKQILELVHDCEICFLGKTCNLAVEHKLAKTLRAISTEFLDEKDQGLRNLLFKYARAVAQGIEKGGSVRDLLLFARDAALNPLQVKRLETINKVFLEEIESEESSI